MGTHHAMTTASLPKIPKPPHRCGDVATSRSSRWRALSLVVVHLLVIAHVAHWKLSGTTLSPMEPSEAMQTLELGYVNAGFILFVTLIVATLLFGRFFCGWACHVVAYQDLAALALGRIGVRPAPVRSRLLAWVPVGAAFYMFVWPQLLRLFRDAPLPKLVWHLTTDSFWATFPSPAIAFLTFAVDGFLIVYLLGGKGFCTYGCPYGAVFATVDRAAPMRIRVTDDCEQCGHCTATCSSNVRVHEEVALHKMVIDPGCMKCLDCVSVCPKDALYLGPGLPAIARPTKKKRSRRTFDFSWTEEISLALLFFLALYAFRGLYGVIPFLLALGLSVIVAAITVVAWRLLTQPDVSVQHHALRRDRRLTLPGRLFLGFVALSLVAVGHSAFIQYHLREGERLTAEARLLPANLRLPIATDALSHLKIVDRYECVSQEHVVNLLTGAYRNAGDYPGAAIQQRRSIAMRETADKWLELATLEMLAKDTGKADLALRQVLALEPGHAEALRRLAILEQRD